MEYIGGLSVVTMEPVTERASGKPPAKPTIAVTISEPNFRTVTFRLEGTAPYMQARFSQKALQQIRDKMTEGSTASKGKKREPRDFESDYLGAQHVATEGWRGIPASAFRNAAIDACRMVGYQMTRAKMSVFIHADGFDAVDGSPLVRIEGEPEKVEMAVRNATGVVDIRVRPLWREWATAIRVTYDADQFTVSDVTNLFTRAGVQVGIGEGRPFSRDSNGMGYGLFQIVNGEQS